MFASFRFGMGNALNGTDGPTMLNYSGGGLGPSSGATINYTTAVVHSGQGGYCITVSPTLAQGGFATVSTTLGATGSPAPYMDTRDLTPYQDISCWVNNQTGAPFTMQLNIQDYRATANDQALWSQVVPSGGPWVQIESPLDLAGWAVTGSPDLTRARLLTFVIVGDQASAVSGNVYLDDVDLIEPGGPVDPTQTSPAALAQRLAKREFDALWAREGPKLRGPWQRALAGHVVVGERDGAQRDRRAREALPNAVAQGWISGSAADAYVAEVVQTLGTMLTLSAQTYNAQNTFLPARYVDRESLLPDNDIEESSADAAYMYLALYQYESLPGTSAALARTSSRSSRSSISRPSSRRRAG